MKMVRLLVLVVVLCLANVSNATLLVHYTFDDVSGLAINDGGDCGTHDGTASSALTFEAGKYGNAVRFSGSNYITIDSSEASTLPGDAEGSDDADFSVSFWMNTASTSQTAMFSYAVNGVQLVISIDSTKGVYAGANVFGTTAKNAQYHSLTTNAWHNIVVTVTGGVVTLYYDGSNENMGSESGMLGATNYALLGARYTTAYGKYYTGMLDDFAIFDEVLTAGQVAAIYNSTTAIPEPATITILTLGFIGFCARRKK
jgi:hypothetical protein